MTLKDNAKRLIQKAKRTPKTKEMSDSTDGRTWYLRDDPLEHLGEEDQFRHNCYVQILMDTVREVSPPFTVGIFGSWGVGKTSIVNDFKRSMASDDEFKSFSVVMIDIWKFGQSIRYRNCIQGRQHAPTRVGLYDAPRCAYVSYR